MVQRALKVGVRSGKIPVLQGQHPPLGEGGGGGAGAAAVVVRFAAEEFLNALQQVLHKAQLAHILRLEGGQFLGERVGVHVPVGGDEDLVLPLADEGQIAAPLIFDPWRVDVLGPRGHHHHDPGAPEGGENIGLVGDAQLALQGEAGEKDPVALFGELVVELLGQYAVRRPLTLPILLLVAQKDIKGLLSGGDVQELPLDGGNGLGLRLIDRLGLTVGPGDGLEIVLVLQDGAEADPVAGGQTAPGLGVLHVCNTKPAEHHAPVGLGVPGVGLQEPEVDLRGPVELISLAEAGGTVELVGHLHAACDGQGHGGAAVLAGAHRCAGGHRQVAAAHFTLQRDHRPPSPVGFLNSILPVRAQKGKIGSAISCPCPCTRHEYLLKYCHMERRLSIFAPV